MPTRNYDHPLYGVWQGMKARCNNPNHFQYREYGAKGITYHPDWEKLLPFAEAVGIRPHPMYSLYRIDKAGHYVPGNVYWGDRRTHRVDTHRSPPLVIDGETKLVTEWAEVYGITIGGLHSRLKKGMSMIDALTVPKSKRFRKEAAE